MCDRVVFLTHPLHTLNPAPHDQLRLHNIAFRAASHEQTDHTLPPPQERTTSRYQANLPRPWGRGRPGRRQAPPRRLTPPHHPAAHHLPVLPRRSGAERWHSSRNGGTIILQLERAVRRISQVGIEWTRATSSSATASATGTGPNGSPGSYRRSVIACFFRPGISAPAATGSGGGELPAHDRGALARVSEFPVLPGRMAGGVRIRSRG